MKKLPLRSIVFSTFLVVVCAAILHNDLRAQSAAASPSDMDPHMGMTKLRPQQPGDPEGPSRDPQRARGVDGAGRRARRQR